MQALIYQPRGVLRSLAVLGLEARGGDVGGGDLTDRGVTVLGLQTRGQDRARCWCWAEEGLRASTPSSSDPKIHVHECIYLFVQILKFLHII